MENIVGLSLPTMTMIISIFLLGMGLGSYLFSQFRLNYRSAWTFFCFGQIFLCFLGLIYAKTKGLDFISSISTPDIDRISFVYSVRLILLCLYILPTAMLVGAGFPLLLSLSNFYQLKLSPRLIYLSNLIGSAMGAILTGFVLLPHIGLAASSAVAAAIHLFAGLLVYLLSRLCKPLSIVESEHDFREEAESQESIWKNFPISTLLLTAVALAGFFNMFLELIFIRYYSLTLGSSTWAYCLVLATILLALSGSTLFTGKKVRYSLPLLFMLAGTYLLFIVLFLSQLPIIFVSLKCKIGSLLSIVLILIWTIFPVSLSLGAILPQCLNAIEETTKNITPAQIYTVNLFAAVLGCLVGGNVAIPCFNLFSNHAIYLAFISSALVLLATGSILYISIMSSSKKVFWTAMPITILSCAAVWFFLYKKSYWNEASLTAGLNYISPHDLKNIQSLSKAINLPLLFYKEGLNSTVSAMTNPKLNVICLKTDGQMEAALPLNSNLPAPSSDITTQIMLGMLPTHFCQTHPRDAFLLGYGTGLTARAILLDPDVNHLTVAELEPAVFEASNFFVPHYGHIFSQNKNLNKMHIKTIDGRCLLSLLDKHYDTIICQAGEPCREACAHLYTLEFWQLARSRLNSQGVLCQWLPLYGMDGDSLLSLLHTFQYVFPNTVIVKLDRSAELILLGFNTSKPRQNIPDLVKKLLAQVAVNSNNLSPICLVASLTPNNCITNHLFNKDDFPFVQYKLQALLAQKGFRIENDLDKTIQRFLTAFPSANYLK